jgi:hypothetical protein
LKYRGLTEIILFYFLVLLFHLHMHMLPGASMAQSTEQEHVHEQAQGKDSYFNRLLAFPLVTRSVSKLEIEKLFLLVRAPGEMAILAVEFLLKDL